MSTITIGVDLAKSVFAACEMDGHGQVLRRRELRVPIKSLDQQVRLSWHRVREGYKVESLAVGNRLRGLLAEFGVIVAQSDVALRRLLADLDAQIGLPAEFKELLRDLAAHGQQLRADERCVRLRALISNRHQQRPESSGQKHHALGVDGESPNTLLESPK